MLLAGNFRARCRGTAATPCRTEPRYERPMRPAAQGKKRLTVSTTHDGFDEPSTVMVMRTTT